MPETPTPEQDPVLTQSLSKLLLFSTLLLTVTLVWALVDETFLMRPWKRYQADFVKRYTALLKKIQPVQSQSEEAIRKSSAYQQLTKQIEDARKAADAERRRVESELRLISERLGDVTPK